jgi:hypothetical protein
VEGGEGKSLEERELRDLMGEEGREMCCGEIDKVSIFRQFRAADFHGVARIFTAKAGRFTVKLAPSR